MVRMLKLLFGVALLALSTQRAAAFALVGPFEAYQVPLIGYNVFGELGGPHNLGEEYRRNTPVIYYTFDQTFTDYFGSNGIAAIEEAFAIMNGVTNVSSYSSDLNEWPLEASAMNFRAAALNLMDLKTMFLSALVEQMGLAEPERWVWAIHDRDVGPPGCPAAVAYLVIKRNFDPVFTPLDELQVSSYVNGVLYTYFIQEFCNPPNPVADAVEIPVDPTANSFSSVAGFNYFEGIYFTGLTRDDVGGLRYLLRTNNLNIETAGLNTLTAFTNTSVNQLLFTSNLTELVFASLTNNAADLQDLFPGLVVGSTTPIFTNVVTTNVFFFFTNQPWLPAGTIILVAQPVVETNVVTWFSHSFVNVVTNTFFTRGFVTVLTTNISTAACGPFTPAGSPPCTQVTLTTVFTNFINGDYYILPTNSDCGVSIIHTQLTYTLRSTNNPVVATNAPGTTNTSSQFSQSLIFYSTNRAFVINPVPCLTNHIERRQGIEHVQFIRYDGAYDVLQDVYNFPITNEYHLVSVPLTNNTPTPRRVIRPIIRPDIIITAMDLTTEINVPVRGGTYALTGFGFGQFRRNLALVDDSSLPGTWGPGTIEPNIEININKVGPLFLNFTPFNLDEIGQAPQLAWGSFDGSTNAPVVYPNGTSIVNYENSVYINVEPPYLPQGFLTTTPQHTNFFQATLSVTSHTPTFTTPVTWSLAPGSPGLPPGLVLTTTGSANAVISGTPTALGTFDFTLRLTDSQSRTTDRTYFIKINP